MASNAAMVIIGAGQAGLQVAESLRAEGWTGAIRLFGAEARPPYQRPPLSKAMLSGAGTAEQLTLRGPEILAKKEIELITATTVTAINRAARQVVLADGRREAYAGLAIATGSRARRLPLPGADLDGIFELRTLDDAEALKARLVPSSRLVVVGGGFIGLEVAASARKLGLEVTVIEAAPRLMMRAVTEPISAWYADLHARHGVRVACGVGVSGFTGEDGRVTAVVTSEGPVAADLVVVGVGVIANEELAREAGLDCDRGIVVDATSRTSDPLIVACGDCTARRMPDGSLRRLESVQNAIEQAKSGAAALMGLDKPFTATPWFWSDQYDVKLQMVGLSAGHDRAMVRGDEAEGKFSIFYWRDGAFVAVDSLNRPGDHMAARKILDRGGVLTPEQIGDPAFDIGVLARSL